LVVLSALLTGCGIFDEVSPGAEKTLIRPGTEKVTDDWNCIVDQKSRWDCFQLSGGEEPEAKSMTTATEAVSKTAPSPTVGTPVGTPSIAKSRGVEPGDALNGEPASEAYLQSNRDWQKLSAQAFVLQVAAHSTRAKAEAALTGFDAPGAQVIKTWSEKGDVFVVIAGSYPDRSSAEAAAEAFSERNAGVNYWIRSTAHFLKSL